MAVPSAVRAGTPPSTAAAADPAALTAAQARTALAVLEDPAKRAELITTLKAIAAMPSLQGKAAGPAPAGATPAGSHGAGAKPAPTAPATGAAKPAGALPIPLAPDSLGAQLLLDASTQISSLSKSAFGSVRALTDFPLLLFWIRQTATDRFARREILDALLHMVEVLLPSLAAAWLVGWALRRPVKALAARAPAPSVAAATGEADETRGIEEAEAGQTERHWSDSAPLLLALRRLPYAAACFGLDLLPIVALLAMGGAILASRVVGTAYVDRVVIIAMLNASALFMLLQAVAAMLASPSRPALRLLAIDDEAAGALRQWTRTLGALGIFGYAALEAGLVFGLYPVVHDALFKLLSLAIVVCLSVIVLRHNAAVARWIRGQPERRPGGGHGRAAFSVVRQRFAAIWHIAVAFYLLSLWSVWALAIPGGFSRMLRVFVLSVGVLVLARIVQRALLRAIARALRLHPAVAERYPGLEQRLGVYHPLLRGGAKFVVTCAALVLLAQAWGFDALGWFSGAAVGAQLLSSAGNILVACLIALAIWEGVNAAIGSHLRHLSAHEQVARAARIRTLLPMLRTALLIAIITVVALIVLSEIGVNIAPLLAGAGVVGLAVGFGSQKLVQDIITGLFLLLENAMQVGDAVTLGGLSGAVETLSVRTIRLRAGDGSIHIIPFSAVTTVTNMTRDFGYAMMEFRIGTNEQPDRISELLRAIVGEMRKEPEWAGIIQGDLEVFGLDRFLLGSWVMQMRIRTTAGGRWGVAREINRRVKRRFDELGIDSPITSYKVRGIAPPAVVPVVDPANI
ncbi:MAG: mechanosensitive ion channel [Rhodospirillales bacterium]|nr:mechanosensitive ion channel [Rhodospirillales bacterium]